MKEAVAVKQTEATMNKRGRTLKLRTAVIAAAATFIVIFVLSNLILDWVASTGLGVFMGLFVGILALEGNGDG